MTRVFISEKRRSATDHTFQSQKGRIGAVCLWLLVATAFLVVPGRLSAEQLTLEEALQIAFEKSPTMQQSALNLKMSESNLKAQQASLKSQLSLTLTPYQYSKDRVFSNLVSAYNSEEQTRSAAQFSIVQPIKWTDGTLSISETVDRREASSDYTGSYKQTSYSNTLQLTFSQPLFTYNRTQLNLKELKLALENAELSFAIQKLSIEKQVTQEFLDLYLNQRSVEISQEELDNANESYEIIESKVNAGISAPEELYQAELTRADSRGTLQTNRTTLDNSLDNFKMLLGLPLETEIEAIADVQKLLVDVDLAKAVNHGLQYRMELRQHDIAIQNAMWDLTQTGADNEFKGEINLSYGLTGTDDEFNNIYDSPSQTHSVELSFNIPLFDWGQKRHRLDASEAQVESQRVSAEEEQKQVMYEIREAFRSLQNQQTQIEIAEQNVRNARLTYEINLERYRNGDLSSKDISFYQTQLSQQQLSEVQALINYKISLLDLKIRSLWDFENNVPVLGQE